MRLRVDEAVELASSSSSSIWLWSCVSCKAGSMWELKRGTESVGCSSSSDNRTPAGDFVRMRLKIPCRGGYWQCKASSCLLGMCGGPVEQRYVRLALALLKKRSSQQGSSWLRCL